MKKVGYIDGRKIRVGGMPQWPLVPGILIPGTWEAYGIFEEFLKTTGLAAISAVGWRLVATTLPAAIADLEGGHLLLATAVTDEDGLQETLGDGVGGAFWPAAGKDIWFEARLKHSLNKPGELNCAFGLVDPSGAAAILQAAGAGPVTTDHLMFLTLDTGAAATQAWSFEGANSGVGGTTERDLLGENLEDLGFHTYGFFVEGISAITAYYDGVPVATVTLAATSIPRTGLMPFFAIKTGAVVATSEALYVDYIMCVQKR